MAKPVSYSILSVLLPVVAYAFLYLDDLAPARLDHSYIYLPVLVIHALGLFFSILALSRSISSPIDVSPRMRLVVLFGSLGIFGNIVGIEYILANTVFHAVTFPPPG